MTSINEIAEKINRHGQFHCEVSPDGVACIFRGGDLSRCDKCGGTGKVRKDIEVIVERVIYDAATGVLRSGTGGVTNDVEAWLNSLHQ